MEGLAMGQEFNPPLRYHIIPLNDLRPHEPEMTCWCRPEINEDNVAVHHSMDGREAFETGQRRPS